MQGKLELMMGPMRSNKTAELLRRADMRRQYAKQFVLVLKPSDDTKGGPGVVESRNPNGHGKMDAITFNSTNPWEVLRAIRDKEQEIGKPSTRASSSISSSFSPSTCSTRATMCSSPASISTSAPSPSAKCSISPGS